MPLPPDFKPTLRPLDVRRVQQQGEGYFLLRDTLGLADKPLMVPEALGPLLALMDGARDLGALTAGFALRSGIALSSQRVESLVAALSDGLFLEDAAYERAHAEALAAYRQAPHRAPALVGRAYPDDPRDLERAFAGYLEAASTELDVDGHGPVAGVVSPHIDYERGWRVYAQVWSHAAQAVSEADVVVVFGTDHAGGPGRLTLTRQSYATPWGVLPTSRELVDALAEALGEEAAFGEELHHRGEHSIELALVWLHYFLRPRACAVVPVLCGSFHPFVSGEEAIEAQEHFDRALTALRQATQGKRVLAVAAADLAHVGPVFGDAAPWDQPRRTALEQHDASLLEAIGEGDHRRFFKEIQRVSDAHRICGMPPIYLMLRFLEGSRGRTVGYEQCPADEMGASLVSIAGATLHLNHLMGSVR